MSILVRHRHGLGTLRTAVVAVAVFLACLASPPECAASPAAWHARSVGAVAADRARERRDILRVVGSRTRDGKVVAKVREKLDKLGRARLRLAAQLCKRIGTDDRSAGSDLAFTLVSALIILS